MSSVLPLFWHHVDPAAVVVAPYSLDAGKRAEVVLVEAELKADAATVVWVEEVDSQRE